ncbi:MAG TPA: hypothetical protein VF221_18835 [Chloroflexota bacterium]
MHHEPVTDDIAESIVLWRTYQASFESLAEARREGEQIIEGRIQA